MLGIVSEWHINSPFLYMIYGINSITINRYLAICVTGRRKPFIASHSFLIYNPCCCCSQFPITYSFPFIRLLGTFDPVGANRDHVNCVKLLLIPPRVIPPSDYSTVIQFASTMECLLFLPLHFLPSSSSFCVCVIKINHLTESSTVNSLGILFLSFSSSCSSISFIS